MRCRPVTKEIKEKEQWIGIGIVVENKQLHEASVVGEKVLMKEEVDKTVYRLDDFVLRNSPTVLEAMKSIPGVTVKVAEESIRVNGNKNVLVLVDGMYSSRSLTTINPDYLFISKNMSLMSKPGVRNIRWQIDDCFLRFWFRFVYPYQGLIESNQLSLLKQYVTDNYSQFTGRTLERYFQEKAMQSGKFTKVGNWWDRKGKNEIDMVALNEFDKTCLVAEIKRNKDRIDMKDLQEKVFALPSEFSLYQIRMEGLSLENV